MNQSIPIGVAFLLDPKDTPEWKEREVERLERERKWEEHQKYLKTPAYIAERKAEEAKRIADRRLKFLAYIINQVPDAANICTDLDALLAVYDQGYADGYHSDYDWDR